MKTLRKVPDTVIAEIRDRTDLVELIGAYVSLKRSGRNFLGLCPFHQEKTPSFNVSPDRGFYHCFGCGVTGDGIRFLMEHDHLSFQEALRQLAEGAAVDLSPYEGRGGDRPTEDYDLLYRAHSLAAKLYRDILRRPEGEPARAELKRRGLSADIVEEYRLGASADAWDRLLSAARKEDIPAEAMERSGLAIARGKRDGHYDRFRGRLMFPIEAVGPKVIGFGGRILGEGEPKYLNSPESPLFHKRKTLYGIPQALSALRESRHAILVEGYTDVLALANNGIHGVLAALGTAFGADHASWLSRSCDRVTVLFDGDDAGLKAAFSSAAPLLGAGLDVKMVMLPSGEDPDSFVRANGADTMRERIDKATGVVNTLLGDDAWDGGAGQERAVRRVLEALAPVDDPLRRRVYLEELANHVGLPGQLLEQRLREIRKDARRSADRIAEREQVSQRANRGTPDAGADPGADSGTGTGPSYRVDPAAHVIGPPHESERTFVAIVLQDEALGESLLEKYGPDDFTHPITRRVVEVASEITSSGTPVTTQTLMEAFKEDPPTREFLAELALDEAYTLGIRQQAEDCVVALEKRRLEAEKQQLLTDMRKASARGDAEAVRELSGRQQELMLGLTKLSSPRPSS